MRRTFGVAIAFLAALGVSAQDFGPAAPNGPRKSTFANLAVVTDGAARYCTNCAATSPCTGSGTGAFAYRVGSAWNCSNGGSGVTTPVSAANGGTGQSTYTKGDLLAAPGGATLNKLAVGTDAFVLTADAASTNGVKWAAAASGTTYPLTAPADSASAPSYTWAGDTNTGMFRNGADDLMFTAGGTARFGVNTSGARVNGILSFTAGLVDFKASIDIGPCFAENDTSGFTECQNISGLTANRTHIWPDLAGTVALTTGTQTFTGKTINLTSNTLTATSAQMATAVSDETGSGSLVFGTAPTITNPVSGGTTPAVSNTTANSCGTTAATIAGNNSTGVITVGATAGTNCTITFTVAAPTRRQCTVTNETTANLSRSTYLTTTTSTVEGTFVAGDLISYVCSVY